MMRKPYGEARRVRYFSFIAESIYTKNAMDQDFLIDLCLKKVTNLNNYLKQHNRTTGIMQTRAVMRNYISYCKWLNLIKQESNIIIPNGNTVYFGSIARNETFSLSNQEKMSFFSFFLKNAVFFEFLKELKLRSTPKDYISGDINEHRAETFLEWCVDLGILHSSSRKFGRFTLYSKYVNLPHKIVNLSIDEVLQYYFSNVLNKKILISEDITDDILWREAMISLHKTANLTRSELDNRLFSALPMIFDLQLQLVFKLNRLVPLKLLNNRLESIASSHQSIFKWNYLTDGGYIQLEV